MDTLLEESENSKRVKLENGTPQEVNDKMVVKLAVQIDQEEKLRAKLVERTVGNSRRVHPIVSLNPYQSTWTIKARVTNKSPMRTFNSSRGSGNVFKVELMDEEGTSIEATMWKDAADKFNSIFQMGKVYYISKGSLKMANKQYTNVKNDYEMNLNINSVVELVPEEEGAHTKIAMMSFNFVKLNDLGPYVGEKKLIDIIGVVQQVSEISTVRRKSNGEELAKREVTIADDSLKTVMVTLWGELATEDGSKLSNLANDDVNVLALKSLRVGDYEGVSLSTTSRSIICVDPKVPETESLKKWFGSEGKNASFSQAGEGMSGSGPKGGPKTSFDDRKYFRDISPSTGEGKPVVFNSVCTIGYIKSDQPMHYQACEKCSRKVVDNSSGSGFWCEGCGQAFDSCKKRYIVSIKAIDITGETWVTVFNEQAEYILGVNADKLAEMKESNEPLYNATLKAASWQSLTAKMSVELSEYKGEKRQRFRVRSASAVDWVAESKHLLQLIEGKSK